jgi:LmbE family N-acetylglucosaminyl deacetylase
VHVGLLYRWLRHRARPYTVTNAPAAIIAPHPDDETLGCGGLIALKRRLGATVHIIFLTDGRNAPPTVDVPRGLPMANLRRDEATCAAAALGVPSQNIHHLLYPDSMLAQFTTQERESAVTRICQLLDGLQPAELFIPHHGDRHPDHVAANQLLLTAARKSPRISTVFEYPIWLGWSVPWGLRPFSRELAGARRLAISSVHRAKLRAISAYKSQLATLPEGFITRFLQSYEIFFTLNPN